jgi:hypothetical protein
MVVIASGILFLAVVILGAKARPLYALKLAKDI